MHLIGFLLRATKQERKSALKRPRHYVSWNTQGSAFRKWAFKYIGVVFTSDGSRNKEIDPTITKVNAVLCVSFTALWWQSASVQRPQNFPVLNWYLFRSFTCGLESWVTTERILSQEQEAEMGYLRRVHGVTLHFVSKCTGLKSVKPGMSSHFSESRDPS